MSCRLLAVGSQVGEVLFYSSGSPGGGGGGELSQRLVCGGSAITCAAWMHSNRYIPADTRVYTHMCMLMMNIRI